MTRPLLVLAASSLFACGDPPVARVPAEAPSALGSTAATGLAPASPPSTLDREEPDAAVEPKDDPARVIPPEALPGFAPPIVQKLGAEGVRRLEVAASVCNAAVKPDDKGGLRVGCRSCAPFTREFGPDGTVAVLEKGEDFYELEHATFGTFTRAGADEVAATFAGCEGYSGNYGGTLIAERKEKGSPIWIARSYRSGLHPSACEPLSLPEGRQLLVCHWTTGKQITRHLLIVYDFSKGTEEDVSDTTSTAFEVYEDAFSACFNGRTERAIHAGSIDEFTLKPKENSVSEVVLEVTHGSTKPGPAFDAACRKTFAALDSGKGFDLSATIPKRKHRFTLTWNGSALVLDDDSAKRWSALQPPETDE